MARSNRRRKKSRKGKTPQPKTSPLGPESEIDNDEEKSKPSFRVEQLEPRILLSATRVDADAGAAVEADADVTDAIAASEGLGALGGGDTLLDSAGGDSLFGDAGDPPYPRPQSPPVGHAVASGLVPDVGMRSAQRVTQNGRHHKG